MKHGVLRKPDWIRTRAGGGSVWAETIKSVKTAGLHTVCEEARCPNRGECWSSGTATFLILGDVCTRGCRFCSVKRGDPSGKLDSDEPVRVSRAVSAMNLDYAVITSVTRDDLADGGASVFSETVTSLRASDRKILSEVLIPDYGQDALKTVIDSGPAVIAHNIEVVEKLTHVMRHPASTYEKSLDVISTIRKLGFKGPVKSSILLGLGENAEDVASSIRHLRDAGCSMLVLGQYLQPSRDNPPPERYVSPEEFDKYRDMALDAGFSSVVSKPLARTSYRAKEMFLSENYGESNG